MPADGLGGQGAFRHRFISMAENGDGPHKTAPEVPVGRPLAPGHDERRNVGGRPRGLSAAARLIVGDDGRALVEFFNAILRGDGKALGVRHIALPARMEAARWLADRAFGRATIVIEQPDEPAALFTPEQAATLRELPEGLSSKSASCSNRAGKNILPSSAPKPRRGCGVTCRTRRTGTRTR